MSVPLPTLPAGPPAAACCAPSVGLDPSFDAGHIAAVGKALGDPLRVRIVDVLRRSDQDVCQCELIALFGIKQPLLSHHMKKLADAGLVTVERRHRWAYYSIPADALQELTAWLTWSTPTDIRESVRERYAASARAADADPPSSCCCGPAGTTDAEVFGSTLYGGWDGSRRRPSRRRRARCVHEHAGSAIVRAQARGLLADRRPQRLSTEVAEQADAQRIQPATIVAASATRCSFVHGGPSAARGPCRTASARSPSRPAAWASTAFAS